MQRFCLCPQTSRPIALSWHRDARRAAVHAVIRQARTHLWLSLFRCNDKAIFRELKAAVGRGVDVGGARHLACERRDEEAAQTVATARGNRVDRACLQRSGREYHAKYVVADEGPALVAPELHEEALRENLRCLWRSRTIRRWVGLRRLIVTDRDAARRWMPQQPDHSRPEAARATVHHAGARGALEHPAHRCQAVGPGPARLLDERRSAGISCSRARRKPVWAR